MTRRFAAGGFREVTRIAESGARHGPYSLVQSSSYIRAWIADFKERFGPGGETIQADNEEAIWFLFREGRKHRKKCRSISVLGAIVPMISLLMSPIRKVWVLEILQILPKSFFGQYSHQWRRIVEKISTGFCSWPLKWCRGIKSGLKIDQ